MHRTVSGVAIVAVVLAVAAPVSGEMLALSHRPVPLSEEEEVDGVGRLDYRGGLHIRSDDERFGGLSGLLVTPDGRTMIAVTDTGHWITARLRYGPRGFLAGIGEGRIGRLLDPAGRPVRGKPGGDAESLARMGDAVVVALEHRHRLWAYPPHPSGAPFRVRPLALALPGGVSDVPRNLGLEAVTALPGHALLAVSEGAEAGADAVRAWTGDGRSWRELRYRRAGRFRPTGAATLPGGAVLVLERRFSWLGGMASRIVRIPAGAARPGATLGGEELARIELPLIAENFEGIAVGRSAAGETLVYIVSDDNFHPLQRTLLLMFALRG